MQQPSRNMRDTRCIGLLVLAVCFCRAAAFLSSSSPIGLSTSSSPIGLSTHGRLNPDGRLAFALPRRGDGQDQFAILSKMRGGKNWRQPATNMPKKIGDSMSSSVGSSDVEKPGVLNKYLRVLDRRPLETKMITSGVICAIGDVVAQALSFSNSAVTPNNLRTFANALEFKRLAIYGALGAVWVAPLCHYWFDALEDFFKGDNNPLDTFKGKMIKALKMVTVDQGIGAPVVNAGFMFLFTLATAMVSGTSPVSAFKKAGRFVRDNIKGTMLVCWRLWPVANLINFAYVPPKLRVLFLNFVGLGWNIFLSSAVN